MQYREYYVHFLLSSFTNPLRLLLLIIVKEADPAVVLRAHDALAAFNEEIETLLLRVRGRLGKVE